MIDGSQVDIKSAACVVERSSTITLRYEWTSNPFHGYTVYYTTMMVAEASYAMLL